MRYVYDKLKKMKFSLYHMFVISNPAQSSNSNSVNNHLSTVPTLTAYAAAAGGQHNNTSGNVSQT